MNETKKEPTEIEKLIEQYYSIEVRILEKISELPNSGSGCDCEDRNTFSIIEDDEIMSYCLNCGGDVFW